MKAHGLVGGTRDIERRAMKHKRSRGHQKNNLLMQIIDGIRGCITQLKSTDSHCANFMIEKKMKKAGKRQRVVAIHHTKRCRSTEPCCSFNVRSCMLRAPCERLLRQWVGWRGLLESSRSLLDYSRVPFWASSRAALILHAAELGRQPTGAHCRRLAHFVDDPMRNLCGVRP